MKATVLGTMKRMRPLSAILVVIVLLTMPQLALAEAQPLGPLWTGRGTVVAVTPCPDGGDHDDNCRAVELRHSSRIIRLGGGYIAVRVLWERTPGHSGPDVLIRGDNGGSGGEGDLFAVTLAEGVNARRLAGGRIASITVADPHGPLAFDRAFRIGYFNGAPNAGETDVPLPIVWRDGDFAVDLPALTARTFPPADLNFRRLAMRKELASWALDDWASDRLSMPRKVQDTEVTVQALADLMLTGHAETALDLLRVSWPQSHVDYRRRAGGEAEFWTAMCHAIVGSELWSRFGLARLPHADLIIAGAAARADDR